MIFSHLSYGDLIIYMDHVTLIIDPGHMAALLKKKKKKKNYDLSQNLTIIINYNKIPISHIPMSLP